MSMKRHRDAIDFGTLVKYYRKQKGWSQKDLAARASCSNATISRIEDGISGNIHNIRNIVNALQKGDPLLSPREKMQLAVYYVFPESLKIFDEERPSYEYGSK